jgi:hypothetical protein
MIIDSQVAFMRTQVSPFEERCLAVWEPSVIKNFQSLFTAAWNSAIEPSSYFRYADSNFNEMDRMTIHQLACGYKDEVAARHLGVSCGPTDDEWPSS